VAEYALALATKVCSSTWASVYLALHMLLTKRGFDTLQASTHGRYQLQLCVTP